MKNIVLIVCLNTKGEEAAYLKELITKKGHDVLIIDIGYGGGETVIKADVTVEEVAELAGADAEEIDRLRRFSQRDMLSQLMVKGATAKLKELCRLGQVEGIISIGGMSSAAMASSILRDMPYRIPKLIFTTGAGMPSSYRFFGPSGVTVMQCLVDVGGLNHLLRGELARAAGAICGMAETGDFSESDFERKPMVAMTTSGWVERSAHHIVKALENEYEVIRYHATGLPEVVMERLIEEDYFKAVIDLVPSSITNEIFGGSRISWPRRLEVAGEKGIPQIVAPNLINVISRVRDDTPEQASEIAIRKHYFVDENRILLWLNAEELKSIAPVYAGKLNKARGPVKFLFPMRGWLSIETENSDFYDLRAMKSFISELRANLKPEIEIVEVDANIDDPAFAKAVVKAFKEMVSNK